MLTWTKINGVWAVRGPLAELRLDLPVLVQRQAGPSSVVMLARRLEVTWFDRDGVEYGTAVAVPSRTKWQRCDNCGGQWAWRDAQDRRAIPGRVCSRCALLDQREREFQVPDGYDPLWPHPRGAA